jgi:predicted PurR-regulated permease PerM
MPPEHSPPAWQRVGSIVTIVVLVAALRLGKVLFVPFALATLFTLLLAPIVRRLELMHLPRVLAVVVTVLLASAAAAGVGWAVYGQLDQVGSSLPEYRDNIRRKVEAFGRGGPVSKIQKGIADVMPDAEPAAGETGPPPAIPPAPSVAPTDEDRLRGLTSHPVPVTVVPASPTPLQFVGEVAGPLLGVFGLIGMVFILVLFMLVYQEDLRDRLIRLVSRGQILRTTQALSDASQRISRYLLLTLVVNACYGIPVGIGLFLIGVPNAFLWGLFATLLRFIPYLGPWIAAAFPILLSFAISPDWTLTAWVVGLFVALELVSNNVVEPLVYGRRTGLSPLAVVVAAIFWTWMWGVVGLFLAIPMTLVLAVLGRYVAPLKFLNILLRDEPGLRPDERYYQRLLSGDSAEAAKVAEEYLKDHSAEDFYDEVVIPALRAAKHDAIGGRLDAASLHFLREDTRTLVEEMSERRGAARSTTSAPEASAEGGMSRVEEAATSERSPDAPARFRGVRVVLISVGDEIDALVGPMLADVLREDGIETKTLVGTSLTSALVAAVKQDEADVVVVAGIPPYVVLRARHLCKRLRSEAGAARVVLALWDAKADPSWTEEQVKVACADRVAVSVATTAEAVRALAADSEATLERRVQRPSA